MLGLTFGLSDWAGSLRRTKYLLPIIMGIVLIIGGLCFGGYYFYTTAETFNPYRKIYQKLGIELPRSFEGFGLASRFWTS